MRSRRGTALALLSLFTCLVSGRATGGTTDVTVVLQPVADAEVAVDTPDLNYGIAASARVRDESFGSFASTSYVYLRFDLSSLPADAVITEATLAMTAFQGFAWGGDGTVYVHHVAHDFWPEASLTWNTRPAEGAVVGSWWLWYDGTPSDQVGTTTTPALQAAVQVEADGDDAISFMLRSPGYDTEYRTREYATPGQRPTLTVRYTSTTDVEPAESTRSGLRLAACAPNPISREGVLAFVLPASGHARLDIVDAAGRRVATLVDGTLGAGSHEARWTPRSDSGGRVSPGAYFARLTMGEAVAWRRVIVVE